jgi:hypothetical protein
MVINISMWRFLSEHAFTVKKTFKKHRVMKGADLA